jgi:hypothetical protein
VKHKTKIPTANELKAEAIKRHGTIGAFAKYIGQSPATVYSALKYRRSGRVARLIRAALGGRSQ